MSVSGLIVLLLAVAAVAVALDLAVIWTWRYLKQRRDRGAPPDAQEPTGFVPRNLARVIEAIRSWVLTIAQLARLAAGELRSSDRNLFRLTLVLACIATTGAFGYFYADSVTVSGWQLWAFLACALVTVVALVPRQRIPLRLGREHFWLVGLFAAALALRAIGLNKLPQGLHVDEAGAADFTMRHVLPPEGGTISPFRTGPSAQPALYFYVQRGSMALLGESVVGLRFSSALAGAMGVVLTYAMIAALHSRRTALLAAAVMATSHFAIHWSRIGLNNIWDTVWVPLVLGAYGWGWKRSWSGGAVIAGLGLGLAQYFYAGSRIAILLLAFLAYRLWRADGDDRRLLSHAGKAAGAALVVAAPLTVFGVLQPELFMARLYSSLIWRPSLLGLEQVPADLVPSVLDQLARSIFSFTSLPDSAGFYRPGVPLVIGLAVPLLMAGVLWAFFQRRYLPVLWIGLTAFLGGFLLLALPASNHYTVAIPAIAWLVAIPLDQLMKFGRMRLALALLVAVIAVDLYFYFGAYAAAPPGDLILEFPPNPWG